MGAQQEFTDAECNFAISFVLFFLAFSMSCKNIFFDACSVAVSISYISFDTANEEITGHEENWGTERLPHVISLNFLSDRNYSHLKPQKRTGGRKRVGKLAFVWNEKKILRVTITNVKQIKIDEIFLSFVERFDISKNKSCQWEMTW